MQKDDCKNIIERFEDDKDEHYVGKVWQNLSEDLDIKKGNPIHQTIDQSKLVPLLTAALQEAIAKIEVLETKVAALEGG